MRSPNRGIPGLKRLPIEIGNSDLDFQLCELRHLCNVNLASLWNFYDVFNVIECPMDTLMASLIYDRRKMIMSVCESRND